MGLTFNYLQGYFEIKDKQRVQLAQIKYTVLLAGEESLILKIQKRKLK